MNRIESNRECIIFYGTPAHGHINPTLPIVSELVHNGYRLVYYATNEFQTDIEKSGAEFREYNFGDIKFNTQIGSQIMRLSELVLRFSCEQLDFLIEEARVLNPVLIMHDTIAFWGRAVANVLGIKATSVNTFLTAYKYLSKTAMLYMLRFSGTSLAEISSVPSIVKYRRILKNKFGLTKTDILSLLMNGENLNIFTYPRSVHPDGKSFKDDCFFLGSSVILRDTSSLDKVHCCNNQIYVSLGTIFNGSTEFWKNIFSSFGNTEYNVLISCGSQIERLSEMDIPPNITLKKYVDQRYVLKNSILFISAGGINSVSEAVVCGVPCLFCPQQGEQRIMSGVLEKLGLGKIFRSGDDIFNASKSLIESFEPNEKLIKEFADIRLGELVKRLQKYINESEN